MPLEPFIKKLSKAGELSEKEACEAFDTIFTGTVPAGQIRSFLLALRDRGETVAEITGAARSLRAHSLAIQAPEGTIDTCGTGGTGHNTLNISTAAALVTAACGVPVAKHGNRAVSGRSGSADVLAALGVNLDATAAQQERALREANICFMFAPNHHMAMKHVSAVRKEMGVRTIFNLLGPLLNPARAKRQLTGVYARELARPVAEVLARLGTVCAWVVHGHDGLDEITTTGPTAVVQLLNGGITEITLQPQDYGIPLAKPDDIRGGDAADNAQALRKLLGGGTGPYRDIVLLNSAAALVIAGKASGLQEGIKLAGAAIDGGVAGKTLGQLIAITGAKAA
ncbi:MAG: anthranilate phosphoribosyltransferase [Alphaproteobacteria bacterium]|nr:anthranilate phosphoribosyltransferase [Alphaproteobacteria bacterium]